MGSIVDRAQVRTKIIQVAKKLKSEGKDIYGGYFLGGDPANVQLSFSKVGDSTHVTYCCYARMFNFVISNTEFQ